MYMALKAAEPDELTQGQRVGREGRRAQPGAQGTTSVSSLGGRGANCKTEEDWPETRKEGQEHVVFSKGDYLKEVKMGSSTEGGWDRESDDNRNGPIGQRNP